MEKKTLMAMACSPRTRPLAGRPWRWAKTLFFLASMLASLLLDCAPPLLVVVLDLLFHVAFVSAAADSPLSAAAMSRQLGSFRFRSSLVDLPIVSAIRSLLILCAFLACGGSRGVVYLGVASACSAASVVYVLIKVCGMASAAADSSLREGEPRRVIPLAAGDEAAAVEALFLVSVAMAIAHVVAAYRISCRERRKMLVYRIDVEAVKVKGGLIKGDIKL